MENECVFDCKSLRATEQFMVKAGDAISEKLCGGAEEMSGRLTEGRRNGDFKQGDDEQEGETHQSGAIWGG